jgi:hypothetical protein
VKIVSILWKTPVVVAALVLGALTASQAGWSGGEWIVNFPIVGALDSLGTGLIFAVSAIVTALTILLVHKIAKPALWLMVPICLYTAFVLGAWDGFLSDFDATRATLLKHHYEANAYALERMNARARYHTCQDSRIVLADDAKAACVQALKVGPGEKIPGSEHRCGFLGMFACFDTATK